MPRSRSTCCHQSRPVRGSARALILEHGLRHATHRPLIVQPAERAAERALRRVDRRLGGVISRGMGCIVISRAVWAAFYFDFHRVLSTLVAPLNLSLCGSAVGPDACLRCSRPALRPVRRQRRPREASRFSIASSSAVDDDDAESRRRGCSRRGTRRRSRRSAASPTLRLERVRDIVHQQQSIVQWKLERRPRPKERTSTERLRSLGMSDELAG